MTLMRLCLIAVCLFGLSLNIVSQELKSRAEISGFEETSSYADVVNFVTELQKRSGMVRLESFGTTFEGRKMPLMIFSDPPAATPAEAKLSGKPIIFIMGNIHAGEVEGKEAVQHLARRIAFGDLKTLLSKITIIMAPIYNADGNEKFSVDNRTAQYGPIAGVGVRENSQKFDLNRDYMKLDSPEAQSLVNLFNRWDPHLTVDLHTTNGSYHGYHLTWSHPLNPNTDQRILDFQRNKMMPVISKALEKNHKFRNYYYGNFTGFSNLPKPGEKTTWEAFTHAPRIGQNYGGLRNRLTILSEAYSYLSFKRRIEVTERFVEEIFKYCAANAAEIVQLTKSADEETVRKFSGDSAFQLGVAFKPMALPKPVDILVGEVRKEKNQRNGKDMTVMIEDKFTPMKMPDVGMFAATSSIAAPKVYLFEYDKAIVEKLLQHGITVEELTADFSSDVQSFEMTGVEKSKRQFQGHFEVKLTGDYKSATKTFKPGTVAVRTTQPLGRLVFYLLEPMSDDGLVTWNFFDSYLGAGKVFPVFKLMKNQAVPARVISSR